LTRSGASAGPSTVRAPKARHARWRWTEFIQLDLDEAGVAVLSVLQKKYHEEVTIVVPVLTTN
jgi:hypothetical protein